jgi:hypothetical protein
MGFDRQQCDLAVFPMRFIQYGLVDRVTAYGGGL